MKLAACFLLVSVGACSAVLADEPPFPAPGASTSTPSAAASLGDEKTPPNAPSSAAAEKAVPNAASSAADAKLAPAASAPVVSTPAAAPAPAAASPDKSELVDVAATDAEIKRMRGRGYKPVNRNGTLVFCRDEGEIGSHFVRQHCSTLKQLKDAELSGKEYVNTLQQQGSAVPFKP